MKSERLNKKPFLPKGSRTTVRSTKVDSATLGFSTFSGGRMGAFWSMFGKDWKCDFCGESLTFKEIMEREKFGIDLKKECECDKCWDEWVSRARGIEWKTKTVQK